MLEEVAALVRHHEYEQKDTLFCVGEPIRGIYIIRHGSIKLQREDVDGNERIVNILRAGDFYGGDSMFYDSHSRETAVAIEKTGICFILESDLRSLLSRDPEIALKIIQYYSAQHVKDMNLLEILSTKNIMRRVCRYLKWQSKIEAQDRISLSQEEMAAMLGIAPETLNRKLAILKQEGTIRMVGHRGIEIVRPQALHSRS